MFEIIIAIGVIAAILISIFVYRECDEGDKVFKELHYHPAKKSKKRAPRKRVRKNKK